MGSMLLRKIKRVIAPLLLVRIAVEFLLLDPRSTMIKEEGVVLVEGVLRPFDQRTYVLVFKV
jgi:hypothetical protein